MARPSTPSDPPLRSIEIGSVRVAYTDEGEGACVLALHGLPGSHRDFRWLGSAIGGHTRMVRIDLPGFGASQIRDVPQRWIDIAAFVRAFAERVIAGPYVVLGHSFGAPLATMVAAPPDGETSSVCGLAWLAPVGLRPHKMIRRGIRLERIRTVARLAHAPVGGVAVLHAWRLMLRATGFPAATTIADVARTLDVLAAFDFDLHREAIARLRVPAFAAWTEDDPFVEPRVVAELCDAAPVTGPNIGHKGLRLGFATGGHNLQKTQAIEVACALAEFAVRCSAAARGAAREAT